jgi:hypothetical protein
MTGRVGRLAAHTTAVGCVLIAAACSSSPDGSGRTGNDTSVTIDAVLPDVNVVPTDPPNVDDATIATTLVPSLSADLPPGPPDELAAGTPPTTVAGPLPVPTVQLVEFGQYVTPVDVASRDLDGRTFVVEQGGRIVAADDLSSDVVLDITDLTSADGERGLFGVAFHPARDLAYVHYTDNDGNTVVAEYAIDPVTAIFDPDSQRTVLTVEQPFGNHNGGGIVFGPDDHLYLGLGDGGSANDPERNGLDLTTRLGKILRIDPLEAGDEPFTVPADNPFVDTADADPSIWSIGLRNPWRFSFDAATGDLWIADVGQNEFEEIDFAPAVNGRGAGRGLSFGWSAFEGTQPFNEDQSPEGHTPPILTYPHADGACSVSGGAVYRGTAVADLVGWYVYGDFCTGQIWGFDPTSAPGSPIIVELAQLDSLAAIAVGAEGDLFAVSNAGTVSRFAPG